MGSELLDCRLAEFKNVEDIGCGGEGFVVKAYHKRFGYVAVKRFLRKNALAEINLLIKCPKHPNLVQLFARIPDPVCKEIYLGYVVEYVAGGSLDKVILNHEISYDWPQIYQWIEQIALGLQHLHQERIIHRDVKPANILVTADQLKLTDFGIAKCIEETLASNTVSVGTFAYMAPEVISGKAYDFSADIYSYAITIWEIINRQVAYSNITKTVLEEIIDGSRRPPIDLKKANKELCQLMERGWHSDRSRRPALLNSENPVKCELPCELVPRRERSPLTPEQDLIMGNITSEPVRPENERIPTHISNASIHGIWAMVDADRTVCLKAAESLAQTGRDLQFGTSYDVQNHVNHAAALNGFTKILPRKVLPFFPDGDSYTVYITIFNQDKIVDGPVGPPVLICSAYPMNRGYSVTVTKQNQIAASKTMFLTQLPPQMSEICGRRHLQSEFGTFLRANADQKTLDAAGHAKECERWHVECHGDRVAFRSVHGRRFLRGFPEGNVELAPHARACEMWEPHKNSDDSWSFVDVYDRWLSIQSDGKVCTMPHRYSSERFWLPAWG